MKNPTTKEVLEDIAFHASWHRVVYWCKRYGVKLDR
jgi:hypothetical protein